MNNERIYTVNEAFELLKTYKVTSNIESLRRWLRQGEIEGIAPASRKEGWKVSQTALDRFIATRLPDFITKNEVIENNTTNIVLNEEQIRADMWYEITHKNIWESFVTIKKTLIKDAADHRGYSYKLMNEVWERCVANSSAYKQPRVSYLLDAFSFEGERLLLDLKFTSKEEQVIYAIFEHILKEQSKK